MVRATRIVRGESSVDIGSNSNVVAAAVLGASEDVDDVLREHGLMVCKSLADEKPEDLEHIAAVQLSPGGSCDLPVVESVQNLRFRQATDSGLTAWEDGVRRGDVGSSAFASLRLDTFLDSLRRDRPRVKAGLPRRSSPKEMASWR